MRLTYRLCATTSRKSSLRSLHIVQLFREFILTFTSRHLLTGLPSSTSADNDSIASSHQLPGRELLAQFRDESTQRRWFMFILCSNPLCQASKGFGDPGGLLRPYEDIACRVLTLT